MPSFQNQRATTSNGGTRTADPSPRSSDRATNPLPAAEIESLLKMAYENLRQLNSHVPVDEIGPGDVQYLRGHSAPSTILTDAAVETEWFPSGQTNGIDEVGHDQPGTFDPQPEHHSPIHQYDLPHTPDVPNANAVNHSAKQGLTLEDLGDVELDISIELGRTELLIEELLKLREGSVVALDKLAGDPVDIVANGRLVGRGELLVVDGKFGVRLSEVL